jgi:hypothetical protein
MNLATYAIVFYLFHGVMNLFYVFALTLLSFSRLNVGVEASSIKNMYIITIKLVGVVVLPFHGSKCLLHLFSHVNPPSYVFEHVMIIYECECLMFWVHLLVLVNNFFKFIFHLSYLIVTSFHGPL